MTNKEAIQVLQRIAWLGGESYGLQNRAEQVAEAIRMAITALENAKKDNLTPESAQNVQKQALKMQKSDALGAKTGETCSDTISRQAAIDAILAVTGNSSVRELYEHVQEHGLSDMWSGGVNAAIDIIIAVPPVQPLVIHCTDCEDWLERQSILGFTISQLPSAQPETCDTCKHGYFGDEQCNSCRVRFTSHYERRNDGSD